MKTLFMAGVFSLCALAQTPGEPPPLIQLVRGAGASVAVTRPYPDARAAVNVLGMTSIAGAAETWLVETHNSFASIEDLDRAIRSAAPSMDPPEAPDRNRDDLLASSRSLIALYRPAWSYRPDLAIRMFPNARYFHISIYRMRPGADAEFAELAKERKLHFDSINADRPEIAYQVMLGAPSGTYLFVAPLVSLRTLDNGLARMSGGEGPEAHAKTASSAELGHEQLLFRVEPRISYVSEEFAAGDPDFWRLKGQ
jgi:hypothetical protein